MRFIIEPKPGSCAFITQTNSPSQIVGAFFIFTSPIPLAFFALDFYPWAFPGFSLFPSPNEVLLLYSFFIMIPLGWCLTKKMKWAREAAILFVIVSILMSLSSIWFSFSQLYYTSYDWIESLIWMMANFLFLGLLLSDYPLNFTFLNDT